MAEYRIEGVTGTGKPVQGILEAESPRAAKQKASQLATARKFKLLHVIPRSTWVYKVQRGTEKPITGEQKAFTKAEVQEALQKMGFRVLFVQKRLFEFKAKPPSTEIVTFVRVSGPDPAEAALQRDHAAACEQRPEPDAARGDQGHQRGAEAGARPTDDHRRPRDRNRQTAASRVDLPSVPTLHGPGAGC